MTDPEVSARVSGSHANGVTTILSPASATFVQGIEMSVRQIVQEQIVQVARQQARTLMPLTDDLKLLDSGLDSLCIAILVAKLDDELGLDPLSDSAHAFPVTIGDFIRLYEHAAA